MAALGGVVLTVLIGLIVLSILGRTVNSAMHSDLMQSLAPGLADGVLNTGISAIRGDFELVEAGMAFTIFAFLPLTQISAAHATVDVFTSWLSERALRPLRAVIEVVFAVALIVIAVQLVDGTMSKRDSGQTTLLLQFPIWWSYAASAAAAAIAALIGVHMAVVRVIEAATGAEIAGPEMGADH